MRYCVRTLQHYVHADAGDCTSQWSNKSQSSRYHKAPGMWLHVLGRKKRAWSTTEQIRRSNTVSWPELIADSAKQFWLRMSILLTAPPLFVRISYCTQELAWANKIIADSAKQFWLRMSILLTAPPYCTQTCSNLRWGVIGFSWLAEK